MFKDFKKLLWNSLEKHLFYPNNFRLSLVKIAVFISFIDLVILIPFDSHRGFHFLALSESIALFLLIYNYKLAEQKKEKESTDLFIFIFSLVIFFALFSKNMTVYYWMEMFPIVAFFLKGIKAGFVYSILFFIGVSIISFYLYMNNELPLDLYTVKEIIQVYFTMVFISFLVEFVRSHYEKELKKIVYTDYLTGIYNRKKGEEVLEFEILRAKRFYHPLSIIMFDIDNFKKINDTYGHDVGDYVLITIAKLVKNSIRRIDTFVRWGGEEFLIILPETDINGAKTTAEVIKMKIENYEFETVEKVTASFGLSELHPEDSLFSLIKRADEALYIAKKSGKNKIVIR